MSEEMYNTLLGWSWERIEAQGLDTAMRWAIWMHFHPVLAAVLYGAVYTAFPLATRRRRC